MNRFKLRPLILLTPFISLGTIVSCESDKNTAPKVTMNDKEPTEKITKTEAEWKAQLTAEEYRVARQAGTERAFGDTYNKFKKQGAGAYHCVGCNAKLFSSKHKFDARCGWPAFYDPAKAENVKTTVDKSAGMIRTEVRSSHGDSHLGHVFNDGPRPTGERYCINSASLRFILRADYEEWVDQNDGLD